MASKTRQQGSSVPSLFSAQLWAAVGLQPKALNISRLVFSPECSAPSCSTLPCSSRSDRQLGASSRAEADARITVLPSAKRQRTSQGKTDPSGDEEEEAFSRIAASFSAADFDALRIFPTRPRTQQLRRPTQQLRSIALDLGLGLGLDLETARTLILGRVPSLERHAAAECGGKKVIVASSSSDVAAAATHDARVEGTPLQETELCVLADVSRSCAAAAIPHKPFPLEVDALSECEEEACCTSGDTPPVVHVMPTSHSGTSSHGVFGFVLPPSPLNDAGGGSSEAFKHAMVQKDHRGGEEENWALCSPGSEEGSVGCQESRNSQCCNAAHV